MDADFALCLFRIPTNRFCTPLLKLRKLTLKTMEPSEMWEFGWEEAKLRQMRRDAKCSFRENLIWLEETRRFYWEFGKYMAKSFPNFPQITPKQ